MNKIYFTKKIKLPLLLLLLITIITAVISFFTPDLVEESPDFDHYFVAQQQDPEIKSFLAWGGLEIPLFFEEEDCTIDIHITPMDQEAFRYIKNEKLMVRWKNWQLPMRNIKVHAESENDYEECENLLTRPDCFFEIINSFESEFTLYFEFTTMKGAHYYTAVSVSDEDIYYNNTNTLSGMLGDVNSYCLHLDGAARITARDILFSNGGIPVTDSYVEWAGRKVEMYPVEELMDMQPVVKSIDTKTFESMKRRWPIMNFQGEQQNIESMSLAIAGEDIPPFLCSDNRSKSSCFFSGLRSVKNNMTVYLLFRTERVQTFYSVFTISDDPLDATIWHNDKVADFINEEVATFQQKIIHTINVTKPIFRQKRVNQKKGTIPGYKNGKVDSLKIQRSTFDFQFIHKKGKNTVIKMDTTDERYRWMYDQYKVGDLIDIYHIPEFKTIRRVWNDEHIFVPDRMIGQTVFLARESYELNCMPEYAAFNGEPITLTWRNMVGVLDDYRYSYDRFQTVDNEEAVLKINDRKMDVIRFDLIVVPKEGKAVRYITESVQLPEIESCLDNVEPETSIYFDKIILRAEDGSLSYFPISFVFHIGH